MSKNQEYMGDQIIEECAAIALGWIKSKTKEMVCKAELDEDGHITDIRLRIQLIILDCLFALELLDEGYTSEEVETFFPKW